MRILHMNCPCGAKAIYSTYDGNIGKAANATGFFALITNSGGVAWVCPFCFQKAKELAQGIKAILKDIDTPYDLLLTR